MIKKVLKSIRANILVGLFLVVPIVVTIMIFNFLFNLTTDWLPETAFPDFKNYLHGYPLQILTLLSIIACFYMIGLLTRNLFGRRLYQFSDKIMTKIPFIKGIYISVRQISQSLFTQRKTLFKEVVLVEYPRKGLYSIAFITAIAPQSISEAIGGRRKSKSDCVSLFIATTPNPTSGVFILVPRSEVTPLDIPVTDALTFIMSAGAVSPGYEGPYSPTLLDKLEEWLSHHDEPNTEVHNAPPEAT